MFLHIGIYVAPLKNRLEKQWHIEHTKYIHMLCLRNVLQGLRNSRIFVSLTILTHRRSAADSERLVSHRMETSSFHLLLGKPAQDGRYAIMKKKERTHCRSPVLLFDSGNAHIRLNLFRLFARLFKGGVYKYLNAYTHL